MTVIAAWVLLPLVLALLALGCGLLLEALAGSRMPGGLLLPAGLAVMTVVAGFTTALDATAELTVPLVAAVAAAGLVVSFPRTRPDATAAAVALATFAVYAAPIVLSGEATFAGYIRLDDTATWMALTDRVMEHGHSLEGLAPSSYEAALDAYLGGGYPVGAFLGLGVGQAFVGEDLAWLIQPYMAFWAAMLALALWSLSEPLIRGSAGRALAAFVAAQPALLFGYYLWGATKEVVAAALIATVAGLATFSFRHGFSPRSLLPLAVVSAALIGALSPGGAVWLVAILLPALVLAVRRMGWVTAARSSIWFVAGIVALAAPVLAAAGLGVSTDPVLTAESELGNLLHPLNDLQLFGVWPTGDFRRDPIDPAAAHVLIAVVAATATFGLYQAARRRAWSTLLYVGGAVIASILIAMAASPWVGGKALATAAPAMPFAAITGGVALWYGGRRVEATVILAAITAGVLWSNVLAYRDVNLAPRDQLAELEKIGETIAGRGPTLMTEFNPYGVRHFLRDADPEGASEYRRRRVPLAAGGILEKGETADVDLLQLEGLMVYRTLVLRRSAAASRPPSPYELTWRGDYYDVWQRPPGSESAVSEHLGIGGETDPGATPRCADVLRLARDAGPEGTLAAVPRAPVTSISIDQASYPAEWDSPEYGTAPVTPGSLEARVEIDQPGSYDVWIGGSLRPQADLEVDGRVTGSVRHSLEYAGYYVPLGDATLDVGAHDVAIRVHGADLHPGSGGIPTAIGPVLLSLEEASDAEVSYFDASQAGELCGKRWDWVEAIRP